MAQRDVRLPRAFRSTHETAGLPNFPAVDVFGQPGEAVRAPEAGTLVYPHTIPWDIGKRVGGETVYLQGADGNTYFLTHLAGKLAAGRVEAGQQIGQVAAVPGGAWQPHIHEGLHPGLYTPGGASSSPVASTPAQSVPMPAVPTNPQVQSPMSVPGPRSQGPRTAPQPRQLPAAVLAAIQILRS